MIKNNRKFAEMNAGKEFNYKGEKVRVIGHTKRKRLVYLIVSCRKNGWDASWLGRMPDHTVLVRTQAKKFKYVLPKDLTEWVK